MRQETEKNEADDLKWWGASVHSQQVRGEVVLTGR